MHIDLNKYDFIVFDCDGVILNSNKIKTLAFENSLSNYSYEKVNKFIKFHQNNGGISRYDKFEYFFNKIMKMEYYKDPLRIALKNYANILKKELISCSYVPGVIKFLQFLTVQQKEIFVNSGSSEEELKRVFKSRKIDKFFIDIKGSPSSKEANMNKIILDRKKSSNGLFFGDSLIDYQVANKFSMDFIFVKDFSEWKNIPSDLKTISDFREINLA